MSHLHDQPIVKSAWRNLLYSHEIPDRIDFNFKLLGFDHENLQHFKTACSNMILFIVFAVFAHPHTVTTRHRTKYEQNT